MRQGKAAKCVHGARVSGAWATCHLAILSTPHGFENQRIMRAIVLAAAVP